MITSFQNRKGRSQQAAWLSLILLLGLLWPAESAARNSGITGRTLVNGSGCGSCHGGSSSVNTSLELISATGSFTVDAGSTTSFTLEVAHSSHTRAGCNIAAKTTETGNTNAGTLTPGAGLQSSGGEVTHTTKKTISGGKATFEFSWKAPTTPGEYWIRAAGNAVNNNGSSDAGDDWNWLTPVKITVEAVPAISVTAPNGGEFCPGGTVQVTWDATAVDNVKIELSSDGGDTYPDVLAASESADGGSFTWNVPTSQPTGTEYRIRVSDVSDPSLNDQSALFSIVGAPEIVTEPEDREACEGAVASFNVSATGPGLQFQWRKDGVDLPGEENATLTLTGLESSDAGEYDVIVSGECGDPVNSVKASLTIIAKPQIDTQPEALVVCAGEPATFTVAASGAELSFRWEKDGVPVPGADEASLMIPSVTPNDEGSYAVVVFGACSPDAVSESVALVVETPPVINAHSESQSVCAGESLTLSVTAEGGELEYQWRKNGAAIPNATQAAFTLNDIEPADAGTYTVVVSGNCGDDANSAPIEIAISALPVISKQPEGGEVNVGGSISLQVEAEGSDLRYLWRKDGVQLPNERSPELILTDLQLSDQGDYTCDVSNDCGELRSEAAVLTVIPIGDGPAVSFSRNTLEYGALLLGESSDLTVIVRNIGDEQLDITMLTIDDPSYEVTEGGDLPISLAQNAEHQLTLSFTPMTGGAHNTRLTLTSNAVNPGTGVALRGEGLLAIAEEMTVDFGTVNVDEGGQALAELRAGAQEATIESAMITGPDRALFELMTALPLTIAMNDLASLDLAFSPVEEGNFSATLELRIQGQEQTIRIELRAGASETTSVGADGVSVVDLQVYPNPAPAGQLGLKLLVGQIGAYELRIVDLQGRSLFSFSGYAAQPGEQSIAWDGRTHSGSYLQSGAYRAVLRMNGRIITNPFIVVD